MIINLFLFTYCITTPVFSNSEMEATFGNVCGVLLNRPNVGLFLRYSSHISFGRIWTIIPPRWAPSKLFLDLECNIITTKNHTKNKFVALKYCKGTLVATIAQKRRLRTVTSVTSMARDCVELGRRCQLLL